MANKEQMLKEYHEFINRLNNNDQIYFSAVSDFVDELSLTQGEKVIIGVYCYPCDLFLYSRKTDGHRELDYNMSRFLQARDWVVDQRGFLYHNISNSKEGGVETKFSDIYMSTFAGKNLRTFGSYQLPKPLEKLVLDNLR